MDMRTLAKLIHKTCATYLPTTFPAHYYGMPSGRIYLVFSRMNRIPSGRSFPEFVFAVHDEFRYDYENEKIRPVNQLHENKWLYSESVDKPNPRIRILKIKQNLKSYAEAITFLNQGGFE